MEYSKDMKAYNWKRVFFSDEKTFQLGSNPIHTWQEHTDRVVKEYVMLRNYMFGELLAITVGRSSTVSGKFNSKVYQGILKQNLKENKLISSNDAPKTLAGNWIFLQDTAPSHRAKKKMELVEELVGDRLFVIQRSRRTLI